MPFEAPDSARLADWLAKQGSEWGGPVSIEPLAGGHSNLTYLLRAGRREAVLRRPPHGSRVKSAHDMGREYRVLSKIHALYPPAPRPFFYCADSSVIGAPFYVMERRHGLIIRRALPAGLRDSDLLQRLSAAFVDALIELHRLDWRAAGLEGFGRPEGYVRRQIEGWTQRWQDAWTDDTPALDDVARWLAAHAPPERGAALIHNDYKLDNLMLDERNPTRIVAVLDWEMATVGDPYMDLGTTLSYWVEPGDTAPYVAESFSPTAGAGFWDRQRVLDHYAKRSGRELPDMLFYYVYGLFKLAVIIQQIYFRYVQGLTADPRFARFDSLVKALAVQARAVLDRGRTSLQR
jgi:aminoglycoside phosphotransferase (APT) family kinase protein